MINSTKEVYSKNDYVAGELDIPKARQDFWKDRHQFNQYDLDKSGCAYHAGIGSISDNYNKDCDYQTLLETAESNKYDYGYMDNVGMYIYKAVDLVRDTWNKANPNDKVTSYKVSIGKANFYEALEKGYSIHTGYRGNGLYNKDKADGVLDDSEFGDSTYGHSIRITQKDNGEFVVDNYYQGKKWDEDDNIYKLEDLEALVENGVFFKNGYIYIFNNDIMSQTEKDMSNIQDAFNLGLTNNPENIEAVSKGNYTTDVRTLLMIMRATKLILKLIGKSVKDLLSIK